MITSALRYIFKHKLILVITIVAWILTLMPFIFDGQKGCVKDVCGLIIGTNNRDGLWFLAVAGTAFRTFPFQMPTFSGATLQGYHYLPNLFTFLLSLVGIPIMITYYKIIPIVYMSALTILSVTLARTIKDDVRFVSLFLFSIFFGMHLSLFTSLYHLGYVKNSALINTFQATRILESPHTALAILMLLAVLIIIYRRKTLTRRHLLTLASIIFISFGTKFYVAATILMVLSLNELVLLIQTKHFRSFLVHVGTYLLSTAFAIILFYNPFSTASSGSVFIFSPFATVHHLIETDTLFPLNDMVLARYFLYDHGWSPRLYMIELFSVFLFVLYYFGTRIIGFLYLIKQLFFREFDRIELVLTMTVAILIALSVLFIQKGDWFNPIQFAVPATYIMNIFVAKLLFELLTTKRLLGWISIVFFVLMTFPGNLLNAGYLNNPARHVIPEKEVEALTFLKNQPKGSVYAPFEENLESDSAYVSALTGKPTYINFTTVLENANIDFETRMLQVSDIKTIDVKNLDVDYIYIPLRSKQNKELFIKMKDNERLKIIYKNSGAVVYTIKK